MQSAEFFFASFDRISEREPAKSTRRDFLLGVAPGWDDIIRQLDADREITGELTRAVRGTYGSGKNDVIVLHGPAGSGKSATLMRTAYTLALEGKPVYFATGRTRPDPGPIADYLQNLTVRPILIFDNAVMDLWQINELRNRLGRIGQSPLILIGLRHNEWSQKRYVFGDGSGVVPIQIPDLSEFDITQILEVLEREGLLGVLAHLPLEGRKAVFREKARQQLLVSMREATKGQGFDEIIRDEFSAIENAAAQLLYLVACIPTMHQYDMGTDQMISALDTSPAETIALLRQDLAGIVVPRADLPDRYVVRHPVIAGYIIVNVAPRSLLSDAYIRYLQVIAHELGSEHLPRRSRLFRLSQTLLNHETLHLMFQQSPEQCRNIYDSVRKHFGDNGHFWLQYGAYELAYGHLDLAENYLLQAEGLIPKNEQLTTTFGHLYLRKAIEANSLTAAEEFKSAGDKMLRQQIARIGTGDPYPYHVLGSQLLGYIKKWVSQEFQAAALQELQLTVIRPGTDRHPMARDLSTLAADCKKAELMSVARNR